MRDIFNTKLFFHMNRTSWEYHQYEQETKRKCTYTENCRFCEEIEKLKLLWGEWHYSAINGGMDKWTWNDFLVLECIEKRLTELDPGWRKKPL